jgi:hypothetical protein
MICGTIVTTQLWTWKTLVIITRHFAKSFLNSFSCSPAQSQKSNLKNFSLNIARHLIDHELAGIDATIWC